MMISLLFSLLVSLTHWVMAQEQPLESAQHAALMSVYDGLGSSALREHLPTGAHAFFCCAFSGCNLTACPRFSSSSNCNGSQLICVGGKVTHLCGCCEKFNDALLLMLTRGDSQVLVQRAIDWHNSVDDWAIDGARLLVSRRVGFMLDVCSPAIGACFRRDLGSNQLTDTISSTIGQLTALNFL
jgi:hypothetical protein